MSEGAGGVSGVGGAAMPSGGSAVGAVAPVGGASGGDVDSAISVDQTESVSKDGSCSSSMSTEDFMSLHNDSVQEPQGTEFDLKKMLEMLFALQLLKEINKAE